MNRFEHDISNRMHQAVGSGVFPGAVLLISKNDEIVFHRAFGDANPAMGRKMQKACIFDLASLTKPLATTLAIAKLLSGHPDLLHTAIGKILKRYQNSDKSSITVDMLLRHTSGLPAHEKYFLKMGQRGEAAKQIQADLLVGQKLENPVGKVQVYSDLGFMVLRQIIETLAGLTLDQYVEKQIYHPLGIAPLFFIPQEKEQKVREKYGDLLVATQQCPWRGKLLVGEVDDENAWAVGGVDGHAGLFGSAHAVWMLCHAILRLMREKTPEIMEEGILNKFIKKKDGHEKVAGFDTPSLNGSSSGKYFSEQSIGHLGFTGTSFWIDPESSIIVILLTNRIHPSRSNEAIRIFRPQIHDLIREQMG